MGLFEEFCVAAKEIADDLNLKQSRLETDHAESEAGFDFTAQLYENEKGFDFHLRKESEKRGQKMTAYLFINLQEGVAPYSFHENVDYAIKDPYLLSRWASWAVFNFRQAHEKVNLETILHEAEIRVYGIPKYCDPAEAEAELLVHGILATQEEKVIIYKFRHVDPPDGYLMRSFSYAICVCPKSLPSFWVIFPNNCGLEGGRSRRTYQRFEKLIEMLKEKLKVEVKRYDVPYSELETFLLKRSSGFLSVYQDYEVESLLHYYGPSKALEGSETQFDRFQERFQKKEYPQALRDLRALVQQAEENVARLKKLDYSAIRDPDISKLATFLIEKKVIDGRLSFWFSAFTSVANLASHRDFPSKKDMEDPTLQGRVLLTFRLGIQLLEELDKTVRPEIPIISLKDINANKDS